MSAPNGIVALDPHNREHVRAAARLHETLLGHSPIPRLGSVFMTHFFYSSLVKDGLIGCYLYRSANEYVGFLSFTEKPFSFMSEGRRAHLLRLAFILGLAILQKPSRVRILIETMTVGRRQLPAGDVRGIGELLSIGVLDRFRGRKDDETGRRISNMLFEEMIRYLRKKGFRRVEWNVDKDNIRATRFYHSYGATLEESPLAWPSDCRGTLDL